MTLPRIVLALALLAWLPGCTTSVVVKGSVPTPLVTRMPARIGVFYPEGFRDFRYKEVIEESGTWNVDLGSQNLSFFKSLLDAMFAAVEEVGGPALTGEEAQRLDGVLVPKIEKYGFLTPAISGLKFYSASIEYRIALFDKSGEKVGEWNIVGYGKSEGGMFGAGDALNEATMLAIRDGGARIAIELIDQPAVQAWLQGVGEAGPVAEEEPVAEEGPRQ